MQNPGLYRYQKLAHAAMAIDIVSLCYRYTPFLDRCTTFSSHSFTTHPSLLVRRNVMLVAAAGGVNARSAWPIKYLGCGEHQLPMCQLLVHYGRGSPSLVVNHIQLVGFQVEPHFDSVHSQHHCSLPIHAIRLHFLGSLFSRAA
jgi:hypothetical protein